MFVSTEKLSFALLIRIVCLRETITKKRKWKQKRNIFEFFCLCSIHFYNSHRKCESINSNILNGQWANTLSFNRNFWEKFFESKESTWLPEQKSENFFGIWRHSPMEIISHSPMEIISCVIEHVKKVSGLYWLSVNSNADLYSETLMVIELQYLSGRIQGYGPR